MRFDNHHQFFFSTISRKFSNLIIIRRRGGGGSSSIDSSSSSSSSFINSNSNSNSNNHNAAAAAAAAAKIIRSLVQQGHYLEALLQFSPQNSSDKFTIPSLLKACSALCDHNLGKTIHGCITALGLQSDPYIATSLINMYVKCGSLSSAVHVFDKMSDTETLVQDVTLWNSIIDGYFRFGFINHGFIQFRRMQFLGVRPDAYSLSILLLGRGGRGGRGGGGGGASSSDICSVQGKQIHGYIVRNVFDHDPFLDTALIDMYTRCGRPTEACKVFDKLEDKSNIVVWNAMISGFYQNGLWEKSLEFFALFKKSVGGFKLGSATLASVLAACSHGEDVNFGRRVHCDLIKLGFERDTYVSTSLLTLYAKCRLVEDAQMVFHQVPADKEIELWNAMISAYIGNHCVHEALDIYKQMRLSGTKMDSFTIANVLAACSMILLLDFGSIIHGELIKRPVQNDTAVRSALLTMYAKCGRVEEAYLVFNMIKEKDVVTWGSMISGFFQNKKFEEALSLFRWMKSEGVIKSDATIMASVVGACGGLKHIELGCGFHGLIIKSGTESDVFVGSTLVDMYARFGLPEVSAMVFYNMPRKNLVAWNSMICCYNRNDLPLLSISLFPQILQHGLKPDSFSLTNVLVAISSLAALRKGKAVHGFLVRAQSMQSDIQVENALVDMYIKCGCLKYAQVVFRRMHLRNIVTWNSMIAGYGSHGESRKAIKLFDEMLGLGILPDGITFLALISSCSHSGLIEEGLRLFQSMRGDYGIEPWMDHYVNMVSLWGRAGHLQEAYRFIQRMPIEADGSVWLCMLWSCRTHRNAVLGELAAGELLKLEPSRGSNYVQLLNLYGEGERWEKAASLRVSMKERGLKKNPGCSWIEIKDQVQVFFSGDSSSSPRVLEIFDTLRNLWKNMGSSDISWDCDQ